MDGKDVDARVVILATGAIPKKLGIPGEADFTGRGVSWCATCDGPLYRDKTVAVVGGRRLGDAGVALPGEDRQGGAPHPSARGTAGHECLQEECFFHPQIIMHLSYNISEIRGRGRQGGRGTADL